MDTISQIQVNDIIYEICDTEARNSINILKQRPIITTYVGSTNVNGNANWQPCLFNTIAMSNIDNTNIIANWYTFSNGIITATVDCILKINIEGLWRDSVTTQRGLGLRAGTDPTQNAEYSVVRSSYATGSNAWKTISFSPRLFKLEANTSMVMIHYTPTDGVFKVAQHTTDTGAPGPQSYATIEVVNL